MDLPRAVHHLLPRARRTAQDRRDKPGGSLAFVLLALLAAVPPVRAADADKEGPAWPFGPLARPAVPPVQDRGWVRNPIDAFVLAKLEAAGLRPSPPAGRVTLLRRVTFDLTGLAPTPAERAAFLADQSPGAYERLVDRLLSSPRFGERWAQHWLDVVRYAETEGFKSDRLRPDAYRYRDYVIRAFNDDLPYDRFLRQQLAGDELEPDNPGAVVATGFYRLHPEESTASNYRRARQDILDDITDVFGATFLGVTVGCARCHDHKFDPITQEDYYRLQAFFAPLLQRDDLPLAPAAEQARYGRQLAAWNEATRTIRAELDALIGPVQKQLFDESVPIFDPETQKALRAPEEKRTALQRQLALLASKQIVRKYRRAPRRLKPEQRARYDALRKELARFDSLKPAPLPAAMAVTDVGPEPPPTYRLATGNYQKPREQERPGFPEFLDGRPPAIQPPPGRPGSTGRRSALARWLCRPDHPLTGRVLMNRVWQHYLGQGIVATPSDFGTMGAPPTHPELLDYLAAELVRGGWRLKPLHRLIVTSATYRQASSIADSRSSNPRSAIRNPQSADPDNKLLWHARVRRREAESVRDVLLQAAGRLNPRMYGPSAQPELPAPVNENYYAWSPDERPADQNRRSVYVLARRNLALPLLAAFDLPDRNSSCPARAATITAPQALAMLNSEFTMTQARHTAGLLLAKHGSDARGLVRTAYRVLFTREPSADELAAAEGFLTRQARLIASGGPPPRTSLPGPAPAGVSPTFAAAVVDFCHALVNAAEFRYIE